MGFYIGVICKCRYRMEQLLRRVVASASTQPLLSVGGSPAKTVHDVLLKMCPGAEAMWALCSQENVAVIVYGNAMALCVPVSGCQDQISMVQSEIIGSVHMVYLHNHKHKQLSEAVARQYLSLLKYIVGDAVQFEFNVPDFCIADNATSCGFSQGNQTGSKAVLTMIAQLELKFVSPPCVINAQNFCVTHSGGMLLLTLNDDAVVESVTEASRHYTDIIVQKDVPKTNTGDSLIIVHSDAPQFGQPRLYDLLHESTHVMHVFASNLPTMKTSVKEVATFPDAYILTLVSTDCMERVMCLGSLDDQNILQPSILLGITPPRSLCIHRLLDGVCNCDAAVWASAFNPKFVINDSNYDIMCPGMLACAT